MQKFICNTAKGKAFPGDEAEGATFGRNIQSVLYSTRRDMASSSSSL